MSQYDHFNNKTPPNNRASKFLSRFAASRSLTFSSPNRTELHNDNSNNNSSKSAAEYFALEMELQNAIEKNIILQTTTEQELFHARSRVEEASEAKRVAVEQAQLELKQAKDESQKLNSSLESERTKVRFLLKKTKALEDSMIEKKKELVAEIKFQEKRAEDIRQSGVRLQLLAEATLKDAGEQTAEANRQVHEMKKSLQLANSYKLHTTLEHVTQQYTARINKLKRIISHLQAEKLNIIKERDIFKEHLRAVLSEPVEPVIATVTQEKGARPYPARKINLLSMDSVNSKDEEQVMTPIRSTVTGEILSVKITKREDDIKTIRSVNGEILAVKIQ